MTTAATVYILMIIVGQTAQPMVQEFTDASRCYVARDTIRLSPMGAVIWAECFPK